MPILSLGELYVSNFVDAAARPDSNLKVPLELVLCDVEAGGCGLLQLRHTAPASWMYQQYWYRSGMNASMRKALADVAEKAEHFIRLSAEDLVLDVGCNDGTLLRSYRTQGLIRVGFEPASNLVADASRGTDRIIPAYFNPEDFDKAFPGRRAKIVTSIAMFYDLEDPHRFTDGIVRCMAPEGIWVLQMSYLPSMLEKNAFDNICVKPDTIILGDNKPIEELSAGSRSIGQGGGLVQVHQRMRRPYHGHLVRIRPRYLEPVVTTPEHPVKVVRKNVLRYNCGRRRGHCHSYRFEWVPAQEVQRGDWVVVPRLRHRDSPRYLDLQKFNQSDSPNYRRGLRSLPLTTETAWLLGLYVAEGSVGGRTQNPYITFTLHRRERPISDRLSSIFRLLGYKTTILYPKNRNSMEVRVVCAALARALPAFFGRHAREKSVPDFILSAPEEIKAAFLRGLIAGDGYIKGNKVHFHASSKTLALQTQLLVASLGGMVGISYVKPYPREIRGRAVVSGDSWQLRGSSKALARIFEYKHEGGDIEHVIVRDDHLLVPVKTVEREFFVGTVYNIATADETYLVSNAVVHNCHEHLEHYSLTSLQNLLRPHDLQIADVELNDVNGGSFRVTVCRRKEAASFGRTDGEKIRALETAEQAMGLHRPEVYQKFAARVLDVKERLTRFIQDETKGGKVVYAYGASTKGNTLLQFCGLDDRWIPAAAERNPDKWGKRTIGTRIPIVSEEQARADRPDYFLVLPWHFLEEFRQREEAYLRQGGSFIVPLPQPELVTWKGRQPL